MKTIRKLSISWGVAAWVFDCYAMNPIVQTTCSPDPAPLVYKDKVYLYTGHDEDGSMKYVMKDWLKSDARAGRCIERDGELSYYAPTTPKNGRRPSV